MLEPNHKSRNVVMPDPDALSQLEEIRRKLATRSPFSVILCQFRRADNFSGICNPIVGPEGISPANKASARNWQQRMIRIVCQTVSGVFRKRRTNLKVSKKTLSRSERVQAACYLGSLILHNCRMWNIGGGRSGPVRRESSLLHLNLPTLFFLFVVILILL